MVVVHGFINSCPEACAIFLDQGSNLCVLHWQAIRNHWTTRDIWLHFTKGVGWGLLLCLQSLRKEIFGRCLRNRVHYLFSPPPAPVPHFSAFSLLSGALYILFFALKCGAGSFCSSSGCMVLWPAMVLDQWPQAERGSLNKAVFSVLLFPSDFKSSSLELMLVSLAPQSSETKLPKQQLWREHYLILKTPKRHMKSATLLCNKDCYYKT